MNLIVSAVIISTLRMTVPVLLAAVGCSWSTKAGVTAFGCEGMIATGAVFSVIASYYTGDKWMGVYAGMATGALIAMLHGVLHIKYRVNATLSGMAVNLLGVAMAALMLKLVWRQTGNSPEVAAFTKLALTPGMEWLKTVPVVGYILGEQSVFFFISILIVAVSWIFMFKTPWGLRLRMVGENPVAANTVGINTVRYKYIGVIVCGVLSGLAGTFLALVGMNRYTLNMAAGRGYVAMVINNLGASNPVGSALSALLFGFFDCLQFVFQSVEVPSQLLMMMPYVFTLVICLMNTGRATGPAGVGRHFDD